MQLEKKQEQRIISIYISYSNNYNKLKIIELQEMFEKNHKKWETKNSY